MIDLLIDLFGILFEVSNVWEIDKSILRRWQGNVKYMQGDWLHSSQTYVVVISLLNKMANPTPSKVELKHKYCCIGDIYLLLL